MVERLPPAMVEREKFDHIEERLRVIEGDGNYAFADMKELCRVSMSINYLCSLYPKTKFLKNYQVYQ